MTIRFLAISFVLTSAFGTARAAPEPAAEPAAQTEADAPNLGLWKAGRWTCLLLGAAAVGVGGSTFYLGAAEDDVVADAERQGELVVSVTQREAKRRQEDGTTRREFGVVSMGIGAALLAAGITLWVLEPAAPVVKVEVEPEPEMRPFGYRYGDRLDPHAGIGGEVALTWSF